MFIIQRYLQIYWLHFDKSGEIKVTRQLCKETSWIQGLAPKYSDYGYSGGSRGEALGP